MRTFQFACAASMITGLLVALAGCALASIGAVQGTPPIPQLDLSPLVNLTPVNEPPLTAIPSGKVRTGEVTVLTMASGDTQLPEGMLLSTALAGNKLYGARGLTSGQVALYEVDLDTGYVRQFSSLYKGINGIRASDRYVVWDVASSVSHEVHIYDTRTKQESVIQNAGSPDVSGDIVVWGNVQKENGKVIQNIFGRNMSTGDEFPIVIRSSMRPRISGQWIIYLDLYNDETANIYAHNLSTNEDFKIGVMPTQGQRIGPVNWYPAISGKNIVWVSAQDNKLHHYNLDTHTDRLLPISLIGEVALATPRNLELDGDILVYDQHGQVGYDLTLDAAFPIPVTPAVQGKWTSSTPTLVSGGRLVWQTSIDGQVHIYTTEVVRDQ